MINNIFTIDDFLPKSTQDKIENLFFSNRLPWLFLRDVALPEDEIKAAGITKLTPGIGCYIKQDEPAFVNDKLLNELKIIPEKACEAAELKCKEIFNARSFMHFPLAEELRKEYDNIHIDVTYDHVVCLYYVNDSEGDTFLFDKTHVELPYLNKDVKLNVRKRVTPKKGRAILFNGNIYHSSSCPSKNLRCIINFNVKI